MKIVLPGGSGQVGGMLRRHFESRGDEVVVLTRSPKRPGEVGWDGGTLGAWAETFKGADVVINLAGRTVNCRYNAENRRQMRQSRIDSTHAVGEAIRRAASPPRVWLQSSTATIYAHRFDAPNDEATGILGGNEPNLPSKWRMSIDLAKAWEAELDAADTPRTRKVALRSAMVMSPDEGGVFDTMAILARRGLGGAAGDGRQYVSWIHEADFIRAVDFLIAHEVLAGPVNLASPHPLPNREFNRILREAVGARFGLPAAKWMLEIGAAAMGTETELILKSRRVVPGRLLDAGFEFEHPDWKEAARDLVTKQR